MPRDERLINPGNYIQKASQHFQKNRRDLMNYADAFAIKGGVGEPPFNTSRLGPRDLNNRMRAKKPSTLRKHVPASRCGCSFEKSSTCIFC